MGNVHMEAKQINYRGGSKKMSVEEAIKAAGTEITPEEKTWIDSIPALTTSNAGKTDQDVIAPEFDAESGVYAVGDKVMYEGKLYEFTTAHETSGDWDSSEVSETTVADELNSLESGLIDLNGYKANRLKGSAPKNDTTTVDITDLGNTIGLIVCTTYRSYALYTFKAETSNLYVQKVVDGGTYPPTITAVDSDTLSIANTDTGASGQYMILT